MNPDIQSVASSSFLKAAPKCYWHFIVKNRKESSFYEKREELEKKILEISRQLGENSFERKDVSGLTPLHVAVLSGNRAGITFLLQKNASSHVMDDQQMTPIDYAKKYKPELLDLFAFELPDLVQSELTQVLDKWHVPLDQAPCEYKQHTHDFGIEVKEMLISSDYRPHLNNIPREMIVSLNGKLTLDMLFDHLEEVLLNLGIAVKKTALPYAVRDHFIPLPNGEYRKQCLSESMDRCHEKSVSLAFYFNQVGFTRTSNPFFNGMCGAARDLSKRTGSETTNIFGNPKELQQQVEGGNLMVVTNKEGKPQILMGQTHFYTTLNYHLLKKTFTTAEVAENMKKSITSEEIFQAAEEMYAQGLLKIDKSSGFLGIGNMIDFLNDVTISKISSVPEDDHGHTFRKLAIEQGLINPFSLNKMLTDQCRPCALQYLAAKELVKKLIAEEFGVGEEDLHIIPQVMYHLDTFLKPGPKHSMFVADFGMNIDIITILLNQADILNLSKKDIEILNRILEVSKKLNQDISPLLKEAVIQINHAGLKTVPMPGIFFDDPNKTGTFNLMNAPTGWSAKTRRYYYIATGIDVGDQLGKILMEIFSQYLKTYENELDVIFIGGPKNNRKDFSKIMGLWNDISAQAGPHCYSIETKTTSHVG